MISASRIVSLCFIGFASASLRGHAPSTVEVLAPGQGAAPHFGSTVQVHYTGTLTNGHKFDSSYDRGKPIEFVLGMGSVIRCWEEGIAKMTVGERAKLTCPPDVAYGTAGRPPAIPAGATLMFDVELVD